MIIDIKGVVDTATRIGQYRNSLEAVRPIWEQLGSLASYDPDAKQIYTTGVSSLAAYRDQLQSTEKSFKSSIDEIQGMFSPIASIVSTSGSTASFFLPEVSDTTLKPLYIVTPVDQYEAYVERFTRFDPDLGKTYKEIWEALYGTRADPERASLYLMRQAFDHFFDKLAPDDEAIRRSPYWERNSENQVTRKDRIKFAANKRITDPAKAKTLIASAEHMVEVYTGLNIAHKRGELDKNKARSALEEMRSILQDWADAIGI